MKNMKLKSLAMTATALVLTGTLAACGGSNSGSNTGTNAAAGGEGGNTEKKVTLSLLVDNTQDSVNLANAYVDAFQKKYPNITVEMETRPGGGEGDNIVKTRLATGDMTDVFFYNSGSLMQALSPEKNMLDLTNEAFQSGVVDSFKSTVSFNGKVYAVPTSSTIAGGWFYNKKIYADLGLKVPITWDELIANNEKIKASGISPVIGSYKDSWTSQLVVLADYYNV